MNDNKDSSLELSEVKRYSLHCYGESQNCNSWLPMMSEWTGIDDKVNLLEMWEVNS